MRRLHWCLRRKNKKNIAIAIMYCCMIFVSLSRRGSKSRFATNTTKMRPGCDTSTFCAVSVFYNVPGIIQTGAILTAVYLCCTGMMIRSTRYCCTSIWYCCTYYTYEYKDFCISWFPGFFEKREYMYAYIIWYVDLYLCTWRTGVKITINKKCGRIIDPQKNAHTRKIYGDSFRWAAKTGTTAAVCYSYR